MPRHSQQFCLCLCSFYIARNSLYTCRGVIFGRKSQAEKLSRTCFKATLRREKKNSKHPHRTGLNVPKLGKPHCWGNMTGVGKEWEGRKRGPRIAIASLAGIAGVTAAQRKWQRRNEPPPQWVGGIHRETQRGLLLLNFAVYCLSRWRNASFF